MDFAVIKLQGHQEVVSPNSVVTVDLIEAKVGDKISPTVLLTNIGDAVQVGAPSVDFPLELEVMEHKRGDKIYVSKFHAKSRFRKRIGFRAEQTVLKVVKFGKEVSPAAKSSGEAKEKVVKAKTPAKKKTSTVKKTVKKPVVQ